MVQTEESIEQFKIFARMQVRHRVERYHRSRKNLERCALKIAKESTLAYNHSDEFKVLWFWCFLVHLFRLQSTKMRCHCSQTDTFQFPLSAHTLSGLSISSSAASSLPPPPPSWTDPSSPIHQLELSTPPHSSSRCPGYYCKKSLCAFSGLSLIYTC